MCARSSILDHLLDSYGEAEVGLTSSIDGLGDIKTRMNDFLLKRHSKKN